MHKEMLRQFKIERLKHDRPVNRMWWDENIFADHMIIRRPILLKLIGTIACCCNIVSQRVEPHVSYIF